MMSLAEVEFVEKPRLRALLDHFAIIADPREPWRVAQPPRSLTTIAPPLPEVLLLVVCGTICDCDDYEGIADWGKAHLPFLRRFLPYHQGVPGERWLTILMNRIDPTLFSEAFTSWVRETWPDRPEFIAIDGKTSRRSRDRASSKAPLHLVSAFATTSRRLAEKGGLEGAIVSIDAIATNPTIAGAIHAAGADYLLAVKANQPSLRAEIESFFSSADPTSLDSVIDLDKGHGRIEERAVTVAREVDWLTGQRRFPGEVRLPGVTTIIRVTARTELKDRGRFETRYYVSSAALDAARAAKAVRGHWMIENGLHWVLDVTFNEDQSRLRTGHGAKNMAVARHFAINLVRDASDKRSLKLRRKRAGWDTEYLATLLGTLPR